MPRTCTVCTHEEREDVDAAIVMGTAYRDLASRYGLSISAVSRHKQDHVSAALARVATAREEAGPASALDRLEALHERVMRLLDAAEADGKASLTLSAVREARSLVELIAKITGELDERAQVSVVNMQTSSEWLAIRSALLHALAPYPDVLRVVSARLLELDAA